MRQIARYRVPSLIGTAILLTAFGGLLGCGDSTSRTASSPAVADIPSDLVWEVISWDMFQDERRSLDVRLSRAVDESVVEAIAHTLKANETRPFDRTFIVYYLPGMEVGSGGWATSHFDPDLTVRILGNPAADVSRLTQFQSEYGENLIGAWENNQVGFAATFALIKSNGGFSLLKIYPDGSGGPIPEREVSSSPGRRFEDPENRFGEFYLLRGGNLELHDSEGVVWVAQPLSD